MSSISHKSHPTLIKKTRLREEIVAKSGVVPEQVMKLLDDTANIPLSSTFNFNLSLDNSRVEQIMRNAARIDVRDPITVEEIGIAFSEVPSDSNMGIYVDPNYIYSWKMERDVADKIILFLEERKGQEVKMSDVANCLNPEELERNSSSQSFRKANVILKGRGTITATGKWPDGFYKFTSV